MGGTIRRLVQQGHDVHIAYETSGNIAVGDEEVTRFMHFINGFNQLFINNSNETIKKMYADIKTFLAAKKPGDMDTADIRTIKGLIRRGEARTACTFNGIPLDQAPSDLRRRRPCRPPRHTPQVYRRCACCYRP